ncbi:hypothetical protein PspLS_05039 [Pyricularia sp. CBS 133598]|nr:hypothetical protein PspLS_05039 [Pyricularia sp. CBS 133598]
MSASQIFKAANTAVITGGASGIGLALTKKCAGAGMKVIAVDWSGEYLAMLPKSVASDQVSTVKADVSKLEDWEAVKQAVESKLGGKINLLALNAGMGTPSNWAEPEAFRKTMDVNFFGVVNGLTALLPAVKKSGGDGGKAAVVITGSKQGITNPPGNPAYNASKAAVKSLAEQLDFDLRGEARVSTHLLVPGWTHTSMTSKAGAEKAPGAWHPEQVVDFLVGKMDQGSFYAICPDNDVDEAADKKRMLWAAGDVVEGRPPLTRWRDEWKDKANDWMSKQNV